MQPVCGDASSHGGLSHPEDTELGLSDRRIEAGRDGQSQQAASVERIDDAVIPQARAGIVFARNVITGGNEGTIDSSGRYSRASCIEAEQSGAVTSGDQGSPTPG
jgi:hypothetical protein